MQMSSNINSIVGTVQERAGETSAMVKARVGDVTTAARNEYEIVRYDVRMAIDRYAREKPMQVIGMCLGAGFLVGAFLKMLWRRD